MTSVSSVTPIAPGMLSAKLNLPSIAPSAGANDVGVAQASTSVTLSDPEQLQFVYDRPVAPIVMETRTWSSTSTDEISRLMGRNANAVGSTLSDQWRGLGSALLGRFKTTQADFSQTVADHVAGMSDVQAFASVQGGPVKVGLTIRTRSGQTVEVTITSSDGKGANARGMQVAVRSSGKLASVEADALAGLAGGFERVLQGLGQGTKPELDLSGLMGYDASVLAGVDLTVTSTRASDAFRSFELHADASQRSISMRTAAGQLSVNVDLTTPTGSAAQARQQDAIQAYLAQFDAAAQRSHSDADMVALFESAFVQAHGPASPTAAPLKAASVADLVDTQAQALLTGLNDFKASFSGDFEHTDGHDYTTEAGHAQFRISQDTVVQRSAAIGSTSIVQTQSSLLDAVYKHARGGTMLDTASGNYDLYHVKDSSVSTTSINAEKGRITSAVNQTAAQQLLTYQKVVDHRVVDTRETPLVKSLSRRLV